MNFLDIHSHILPAVDDGADSVETSITLLEMLAEQGVTDVVATPHFYPDTDNIEQYIEFVTKSYNDLLQAVKDKALPNVFLGCELRYFNGMGKSRAIKQFALSGTNYLLLELPYGAPITKTVLQDITDIREQQEIIPILAHIERYFRVPGFKKLLKLISDGTALAHINAGAVVTKDSLHLCEKLIKGGYVSFVASDTHSPEHRPPQIKDALTTISNRLGKSVANRLIIKSNRLLEEIEAASEK